MLAKYKTVVDLSSWSLCFLPVDFLEVACRAELLPTCLSANADREFKEVLEKIKEVDPILLCSLEEPVDYARLRQLPITIFGTRSSGSHVNKGDGLPPGTVLGKYVTYANLDVQCPPRDTIEALETLVRKWLTTPAGKGDRARPRSVHVFWSMQEYWKVDENQERLNHPTASAGIKKLQSLITALRQEGHQVYVCVYAGIPHIRENPCDEQQLGKFEESVMSCVSSGGADALVDRGLGFWTEHHKLWGDNEWFSITTTENEVAVSRVLDQYIMRQKTMLTLTVHPECNATYEGKMNFRAAGIGLLPAPWPEDVKDIPEQDWDDDDQTEQTENRESDEMQEVENGLYANTTVDSLAHSYELKGEGQTRYWIKQQPENCCLASFKQLKCSQTLCRIANCCLFCSAKRFEEKDKQDGLNPRRTAAAVSLLSKSKQWSELPTDKIFDFIYTLD